MKKFSLSPVLSDGMQGIVQRNGRFARRRNSRSFIQCSLCVRKACQRFIIRRAFMLRNAFGEFLAGAAE